MSEKFIPALIQYNDRARKNHIRRLGPSLFPLRIFHLNARRNLSLGEVKGESKNFIRVSDPECGIASDWEVIGQRLRFVGERPA